MNELDGGGWPSQMVGAEGSVPWTVMYQREQHAQGTRELHLACIQIHTSDATLIHDEKGDDARLDEMNIVTNRVQTLESFREFQCCHSNLVVP